MAYFKLAVWRHADYEVLVVVQVVEVLVELLEPYWAGGAGSPASAMPIYSILFYTVL